MISQKVIFHCPRCQSINVVKNGKNCTGNQQFLCKDCHKAAVMHPQHQRTAGEQAQILAAYHERPSMRGIARTYHISRNTLKKMLKKRYVTSPRSKRVYCLRKAKTS